MLVRPDVFLPITAAEANLSECFIALLINNKTPAHCGLQISAVVLCVRLNYNLMCTKNTETAFTQPHNKDSFKILYDEMKIQKYMFHSFYGGRCRLYPVLWLINNLCEISTGCYRARPLQWELDNWLLTGRNTNKKCLTQIQCAVTLISL